MLVVFVLMAGFGVVAPILPLFARSFGVGYAAAGGMISAFAAARLAFDLVAGPLIDRYGERRAATLGMTFLALCALLTANAPNFALATIFWAAGGAGSAVVFASNYSYLLKVVPKDRMARTLGVFYGAFNAGIIAGGFAGGFIADRFGIASPLLAYSGLLLIAVAVYMRFVPAPVNTERCEPGVADEARAAREVPAIRRSKARIVEMLKTPAFKTVMVVNFAYMWFVAGVFDTLVPLLGKDAVGMSTLGIGAVFGVALATEFAVLYPAGSLADSRGRKAVMVPSLIGLALAITVAGWATTVWAIVAAMAVLGVFSGFAGVPPGAMLSDVTPEGSSGTAVGIFRFSGDLGFALGPVIAGITTNAFGFRGSFAIAAIPILAALVLVLRTPETLRRPAAAPPKSVASPV
jgi:MFS family permease